MCDVSQGRHFFCGGIFGLLKQPASYKQQMEKLRARGCAIADEKFCEQALSQLNYYRLSAYFLPFRQADGAYRPGTNFHTVFKMYEFDMKLRRILFSAIEEIEVCAKAQIAYYHAHKYGADGYLDANNYNSSHSHGKFIAHIEKEKQNNGTAPFVRHHNQKYAGLFPIWVIMEIFTFGMLSKFYADLLLPDQKHLAKSLFGSVPGNVKSWLRCCTDLRNICAHYGRLYYRIFSAIPAGFANASADSKRRLFGAILAAKELYPDKRKWDAEVLSEITALTEQYAQVVQLKHIGFPPDWEKTLRKGP
jgi:abortive infection bacteriophage resistance protein